MKIKVAIFVVIAVSLLAIFSPFPAKADLVPDNTRYVPRDCISPLTVELSATDKIIQSINQSGCGNYQKVQNNNPILIFLFLFLANIIVELVVAYIYLYTRRAKGLGYKMPILSVVLANLLSYPIFFFAYTTLSSSVLSSRGPTSGSSEMILLLVLVPMEALVIAFESLVIWLICRKKMKYSQGLIISLIINASTILMSIPIHLVLASYIFP